MTDLTAEQREREKEMIENPMRWPLIRLPLKNPSRREGGWPQMGFLEAGMTHPPDDPRRTVRLGSMYEDSVGEEEFADVDALLDAGWRVD